MVQKNENIVLSCVWMVVGFVVLQQHNFYSILNKLSVCHYPTSACTDTFLLGQPLHTVFDMICGSSTGAILAAVLGGLGKSAEDAYQLYTTRENLKGNKSTTSSMFRCSSCLYRVVMVEAHVPEPSSPPVMIFF